MTKPNGTILYQGPSALDGAPIVVILTGTERPTRNTKTGPMLQTWILRADVAPHDASKNGDDVSICGACPHRRNPETGTRTCYVRTGDAPLSIWRADRRGRYPRAEQLSDVGANQAVRVGAYGDPAAVPVRVWDALLAESKSHTAYTHQWRESDALAPVAMASVDSPAEREEASAAGWRTFRVRGEGEPLLDNEIDCPATPEGGSKTQCARCGLCSGNMAGRKRRVPDISLYVHGAGKRHFVDLPTVRS